MHYITLNVTYLPPPSLQLGHVQATRRSLFPSWCGWSPSSSTTCTLKCVRSLVFSVESPLSCHSSGSGSSSLILISEKKNKHRSISSPLNREKQTVMIKSFYCWEHYVSQKSTSFSAYWHRFCALVTCIVFLKFILLYISKLKTSYNEVLNFKLELFLVGNAVTRRILLAWNLGKTEEQEVSKNVNACLKWSWVAIYVSTGFLN